MPTPRPGAMRALRFAVAAAVLLGASRAASGALVIVEIHYHPAGTPEDGERLEFVEILNDEPLPFDMSGYSLAGGVGFAFPEGTEIPGRSVVVVAADPEALAAAYGIEKPFGPWSGRLGNEGDDVRLIDTGGSTVSRADYRDRGGWPAAPDGAGPSLVLRGPLADTREGESWGWSRAIGGTPGELSFDVVAPGEADPGVVINEVFRDAGGGWVELFNRGGSAVDLGGYRLLGDAAGAREHRFAAGAAIAAGGFVTLSTGELGFALDLDDQPLFLVAPDGVVLDARRLAAALDGAGDGRIPDGGPRWFRLPAPTRGAANTPPPVAPIVISEIHYHPPSPDEAEEFVELTSIGEAPLSLAGFAFTSGIDYVFPEDAVIAPGESIVVARDPERLEALHGITGVLGPFGGALSNSGELLRLSDPLGNPADEVRYHDEGSWPEWADGDGPSLELTDLRQENRTGHAWRESDEESRSQWHRYEYTASQGRGDPELHLYLLDEGEILIDDIEVRPAEGGDNHIPDGGFDGPDPLAEWVIEGTHIDSRVEAGAGVGGSAALRIVSSGRGDSRVNRIERQTVPPIRSGRSYTVSFMARWLKGSHLLMTRSWNHGLARVTSLEIPAAGGTPGRANSRAVANSGPVIAGVEQSPALPAPGDPVTVRCRVADPDGVASVTLRFRLDGEAEFGSLAMTRESAGGAAGDSYAGVIDGIGERRSVGEFFISARDAGGRERIEPPEAPEETFIYQYDDGIEPLAVPTYRVVMRRRDRQELGARSELSNHLLPATFIRERDAIFHRAGVRYRGSPFLRDPGVTRTRKGIRVRLSDERPLVRSVRLTLDEQAVDPTVQVDRLVRRFLQKAGGIPYGERRHIKLVLAGVAFSNTYEHVLHVDGRYLERAFGAGGSGGDLYKIDAHYEIDDRGDFPFPSFTSWKYTADKEDLRFVYKKRSREETDDFSQLIELLDLMDLERTSNEEFDARAGELIELDQWIKAIAVYRAVEDWDAIGGWTGKNVYLYRVPGGKWNIIPWDHDVALGSAALRPDQNPRAYLYTPYFPEIRRLLQRPALDRRFNSELLRLMEEDYRRDVLDPILDRTFAFLRSSSGAQSPARLKSFLSTRRAFILSRIDDPPAFTIETNGGEAFATSEASVTLEGKAPFRIVTILAGEGDPAEVVWKDRETWSLDVSLAEGLNPITLLGFDDGGELAGTVSIDITRREDAAPSFVRGDANGDGTVNLSDAIAILAYLFQGGALGCADAADADDSGVLDITDPIRVLAYLFQGGPEPPPPFGAPGPDPTSDGLECEVER